MIKRSCHLTSPRCFSTCHTDEKLLHSEGDIHRCVSVSFPSACAHKPETQQRSNPYSLLRHKAAAICGCTYSHLFALSSKVCDHCIKLCQRTGNLSLFFVKYLRLDTLTYFYPLKYFLNIKTGIFFADLTGVKCYSQSHIHPSSPYSYITVDVCQKPCLPSDPQLDHVVPSLAQ